MNVLSDTAAQTAQVAPELFFQPMNFIANLRNMGIGMLVIFVIIGVIILATTLVSHLLSK